MFADQPQGHLLVNVSNNLIFVTSFKDETNNYQIPQQELIASPLRTAGPESFPNCERLKRESLDRGCVISHPKLATPA
jgi:hypothetical protein